MKHSYPRAFTFHLQSLGFLLSQQRPQREIQRHCMQIAVPLCYPSPLVWIPVVILHQNQSLWCFPYLHWYSYVNSIQVQHELKNSRYRWGIFTTREALNCNCQSVRTSNVSQALAMRECWHTEVMLSSKDYTHSLLLQIVKKQTRKKKVFYPQEMKALLLFIIGAIFSFGHLRLAMPYSIKLSHVRYACVQPLKKQMLCFSVLTELEDLVQCFLETYICRKTDLWGQEQNLKISSLLSNRSQM